MTKVVNILNENCPKIEAAIFLFKVKNRVYDRLPEHVTNQEVIEHVRHCKNCWELIKPYIITGYFVVKPVVEERKEASAVA